jgi:Zn-dependent peptidase ImmA (M78 family)
MDCLICKDLERAFESRHNDYLAARSAAYYRVSTELAAYKNVTMERAKSDLQEHQLVCLSGAGVKTSLDQSVIL